MQDLNIPDIDGLFIQKGWLYKLNGMVFGPAPDQTIIDKIYTGELTGESEVAEGEGLWMMLRQVQMFYPHVIQADAKFRSVKIEAEKQKAARRKNMVRGARMGAIALVSVAVLVSGGLVLNKFRPWERFTKAGSPENIELRGATMDEWVERHPPLVSLGLRKQQKEDEKKEALTLTKAEPEASKADPKKGKKPLPKKGPEKGGEKPAGKDEPAKETKVASKSSAGAPSSQGGGELEQISDAEIYQTIQSNIPKLFVCLREELKRTPDLRGQLEIEFVIKNDGHVGDVFIDDFRFKEGPLKDCFKQKFSSWRFSRYSGERRIVKYPFFIGKK